MLSQTEIKKGPVVYSNVDKVAYERVTEIRSLGFCLDSWLKRGSVVIDGDKTVTTATILNPFANRLYRIESVNFAGGTDVDWGARQKSITGIQLDEKGCPIGELFELRLPFDSERLCIESFDGKFHNLWNVDAADVARLKEELLHGSRQVPNEKYETGLGLLKTGVRSEFLAQPVEATLIKRQTMEASQVTEAEVDTDEMAKYVGLDLERLKAMIGIDDFWQMVCDFPRSDIPDWDNPWSSVLATGFGRNQIEALMQQGYSRREIKTALSIHIKLPPPPSFELLPEEQASLEMNKLTVDQLRNDAAGFMDIKDAAITKAADQIGEQLAGIGKVILEMGIFPTKKTNLPEPQTEIYLLSITNEGMAKYNHEQQIFMASNGELFYVPLVEEATGEQPAVLKWAYRQKLEPADVFNHAWQIQEAVTNFLKGKSLGMEQELRERSAIKSSSRPN